MGCEVGTRERIYIPVFVNECIESHAVSPARGEIVNVDIWITVTQQKGQNSESDTGLD